MGIQVFASEPHYRDHLEPIVAALPPGYATFSPDAKRIDRDSIVLVASYKDYRAVAPRRVVFSEHGVGYSYETRHRAYAGGPDRDRVLLFLNANERVARLNQSAYPDAQHALVGSPRLDALARIAAAPDIVTFSWHWDCRAVPETRSAFAHYRRELRHLSGTYAGHAHPRAWPLVSATYHRLGWEILPRFETVVARASVYVCDTSSTIYEMAALDRPVVLLNAPWYRRTVSHGLRFWEDLPGETVDSPRELQAAIDRALTNDIYADVRRSIAERLYPYRGEAAARAAAAILAVTA